MPGFTSRRNSGNSSEFASAKRGTAARLSQLKGAVERDSKRWNLETLDTFIEALDTALIPSSDIRVLLSPEWKEQSDCALQALGGLTAVARALVADGVSAKMVRQAVDRLTSAFDSIISWMLYLLHFGYAANWVRSGTINFSEAYFAHSRTLRAILSSNPCLDESLQESPAAIDLVLRLWMKKGKNGEPFADFSGRQLSCPILRLMLHCINSDEGLAAVVDRIHFMPHRTVAMFTKMTTVRSQMLKRRLTSVNGLHGPSAPPVVACVEYCRDLSNIVFRLAQDKRIWDSFLRTNFVTHMTRAVLALPKGGDSWELLVITIHVLRSFLVHSNGALRNLEVILEPEFFSFIMRVLQSAGTNLTEEKPDAQTLKGVDGVLRHLDVLAVWPRVLRGLEASLKGTQRQTWDSLENLPSVGQTWKHFRTTVEDRLRVDDTIDEPVVRCDNPYCASKSVLLRMEAKSKKCSGCRSFAYCSKLCQRHDWNVFHREECGYARLEHLERKRWMELYTPRMRAFHLALMERRFNLFIARHIDRTSPDKRPENEMETGTFSPSTDLATSHTRFYTFDASQPFSRIMCVPPGSYGFRRLPVLDEPWVQRRFEEGFLKATGECEPVHARPEGPDLAGDRDVEHFVEGVFMMGDKEVLVMVKMRVFTDKGIQRSKFCAASSVVRIGRRRP